MEKFKDKKILVTGGTGSFGHAVTDRLLSTDCAQIHIFSRDEWKQEQMRIRYSDSRLHFHIGNVRDTSAVDQVMRGVHLVFHAAALKQVPSCEFFPLEAVQTNILGSNNVLAAAIAHGVETVVCLSTDKAAYPINAMGMSKGLMEKVAVSQARSTGNNQTTICCVRYGNVMYSRGSVIPLFVQQIQCGQPLTITYPQMTRFMLPLSDAVDLVLYALAHAHPGDLFVKKAPACTIGDLAGALQHLFQSEVPENIIGIRHGEKIFETLATKEELTRAEDMGQYYRITPDGRDLNYSNYEKYFTAGDIHELELEDYTSHNTQRLDKKAVEKLLLSLPEIQQVLKS